MTEQELLDLKQEITEAKQNMAKLEGRKESLMEQLNDKFKVKTVAAAQKKIESLAKDIVKQDKAISTATAALEEQLQTIDSDE